MSNILGTIYQCKQIIGIFETKQLHKLFVLDKNTLYPITVHTQMNKDRQTFNLEKKKKKVTMNLITLLTVPGICQLYLLQRGKVSKVGDRSWEWPEGSLFNSYYTKV